MKGGGKFDSSHIEGFTVQGRKWDPGSGVAEVMSVGHRQESGLGEPRRGAVWAG